MTMRRREFIGLSTAMLGLGYGPLGAQESTRRLGLLMPYERTDPEDQQRVGALVRASKSRHAGSAAIR